MGWLRLVGSLKLQVSFAKEPYKRDDILPKFIRMMYIHKEDTWNKNIKKTHRIRTTQVNAVHKCIMVNTNIGKHVESAHEQNIFVHMYHVFIKKTDGTRATHV